MGKSINQLNIIGLLFFLFIPGCDLPTDPGPLPSTIINTEFNPGHNILGILRIDGITGSSFIRVERAYKVDEVSVSLSSAVVDSAMVTVSWEDTTVVFEYFPQEGVYKNARFIPETGIEYFLEISSDSLPKLTATTSIEKGITIEPSFITISNNHISIIFAGSPTLDLYDVYLVSETDKIHQRIPGDSSAVELSFDLDDVNGTPQTVEIYGYESNLTKYLQSSITIKPQAYHETVTTVENGYGCFGAVQVLKIEL